MVPRRGLNVKKASSTNTGLIWLKRLQSTNAPAKQSKKSCPNTMDGTVRSTSAESYLWH